MLEEYFVLSPISDGLRLFETLGMVLLYLRGA